MATISFATKKPKTQELATMKVIKEALGTPISTESFLPEDKPQPPTPAVTEQPKSTISFSKPAATPAAKPEETKTSTAVDRHQPSNGQLQGEFGSGDIAVPYLSLGQKTGDLTDENPDWIGKWIFDKTTLIGETARVIIARMTKRYEEDLPFGSENIPRRYQFADDARKEGVQVRDVADIDLLVETVMEGADGEEFGAISYEKKTYLPVRYTVRSSAYGASVKIIMKDLAGWLHSDLSSGFYTLGAVKRVGPKGSWFVPSFKPDGKVPDALRAMIAERFQN